MVPKPTNEVEACQRGTTGAGQSDGTAQAADDTLCDVIRRTLCRGAEGQASELFRIPGHRHQLFGQNGLHGVTTAQWQGIL